MRDLWRIFWVFARIGSVTFGGGYAMLPIIQRELVEKRGWTSEENLLNYFALGQSVPGVIAVNAATFIGHERRGVPGAIAATLGVIFPSVVVITIIAAFLQRFQEFGAVQHAFAGIRIGVVALIVSVVLNLGRQTVKNARNAALFFGALIAIGFFDISPIAIMIFAAAVGMVQVRRSSAWLSKRSPEKENGGE